MRLQKANKKTQIQTNISDRTSEPTISKTSILTYTPALREAVMYPLAVCQLSIVNGSCGFVSEPQEHLNTPLKLSQVILS